MKYGEISHFSHPQHKLKFEYSEFPFKCDGCKEVGIGSRYKCAAGTCDFDLHMPCAIPSSTILHPFYTECSFQFFSRPPGDKPRYCNACERDVSGFIYHCTDCGFDLHPCCAKLPMILDDGDVKLYLNQKVADTCHKCGRKGRSWSYRSSCKKYNLHVACVKDMLVESWHDLYYYGRYKMDTINYNTSNYSINYTIDMPKSAILTTMNNNTKNNNYNYNYNNLKLETRVPSLKNTLQTHHKKGKGKVKRCCEIAGLAVQFVISAVLGDPTTLIAGVIGALISRA